MYASAILQLASAISRNQFMPACQNIRAAQHTISPLSQSIFTPGIVSGHNVCPRLRPNFTFKKKRKRGGRIKPRRIDVVTTGNSGLYDSHRSVNKTNLISVLSNHEDSVPKNLNIGLLNVNSVGKKRKYY